MATDYGYVVPPMHIKDNLELSPGEYSITIKGIEVARAELMVGHFLAMKTGEVDEEISGVDTVEPCLWSCLQFGLLPRMKKERSLRVIPSLTCLQWPRITEIQKSRLQNFWVGRRNSETSRYLL